MPGLVPIRYRGGIGECRLASTVMAALDAAIQDDSEIRDVWMADQFKPAITAEFGLLRREAAFFNLVPPQVAEIVIHRLAVEHCGNSIQRFVDL